MITVAGARERAARIAALYEDGKDREEAHRLEDALHIEILYAVARYSVPAAEFTALCEVALTLRDEKTRGRWFA